MLIIFTHPNLILFVLRYEYIIDFMNDELEDINILLFQNAIIIF